MERVDELAYLGIAARDPGVWSRYASEVMGVEVRPDSDDQNLYLRMDERHHRMVVHPCGDQQEDVLYVGWQVRDAGAMDRVAGQLDAAGVGVAAGTPEECETRRVLGLVHFEDPHSGVRMEVAWGPEVTFQPPYLPSRAISGFVTGQLGLGHYVTYVPDVPAAERFYAETLGFAASDAPSMPGVGQVASFMYCNPRHHSLAFFGNPEPRRRTYHVMLEYKELDDVGSALDICRAHDSVKVDLGRHNNDRAVSFYAENPSGWLFEYGWGGRVIDPENFAVEHFTIGGGSGMGEWGHAGLPESLF